MSYSWIAYITSDRTQLPRDFFLGGVQAQTWHTKPRPQQVERHTAPHSHTSTYSLKKVLSCGIFPTNFKLVFTTFAAQCKTGLRGTHWLMTCFHPSSCLLPSYPTPANSWAWEIQGPHDFSGKTSAFLRFRPSAVKADQLLLDSSYTENASLALHGANDSRGTLGGGQDPRPSLRHAPLALQQMFRCGRPAAIHFLRTEKDRRREVERHHSLRKWNRWVLKPST